MHYLNITSNYKWHFAWLVLALAYVAGLFTPLMEVDESEYACISREMLSTGHYLIVKKHSVDYLDKPPLLFWLSTLSFALFGISEFAFKLPSVVFSFLGFYSTYRLGTLLFDKNVGRYSAIILAASLAMLMMNQDVRTDALLCSFIIFTCWQLLEYFEKGKLQNALLCFVGMGCAMMAKGPIGLMIPSIVGTATVISRKSLGNLLSFKTLASAIILPIMLAPMCYGLYEQYGLHGLRFYFWEQSFGRITGENSWHNDADGFFFIHTFLWAFLPFTILFVVSIIRLSTKPKLTTPNEWVILTGFLIPFAILSMSHYKLPHYINVVLPFAALLTAVGISKTFFEAKFYQIFQFILMGLILLLAFILNSYFFNDYKNEAWVAAMALLIIAFGFAKNMNSAEKLLLPSVIVIGISFLMMNINFYPSLAKYDGGTQVGLAARNNPYSVFTLNTTPYNTEFYAEKDILNITPEEIIHKTKPLQITTNEAGFNTLQEKGLSPTSINKFQHFPATMLNWKFLNPQTRQNAIETRYLLQYN